MKRTGIRRVFIVGAGFSHYAGLPLQSQFTAALLEAVHFRRSAPSRQIVEYLNDFIREVFGVQGTPHARKWPELEDIFTCIDLSANMGHHLGAEYSPTTLRTVRRALIVRIIRMLHQRYRLAKKRHDPDWETLETFFRRVDLSSSGFISMNWDTVIEQGIAMLPGALGIDYCCDAISASFPKRGDRRKRILLDGRTPAKVIPVIKMHGSTNWLYCDNCSSLFSFPADDTIKIAEQLLGRQDWRRIAPSSGNSPIRWRCHNCPDVPLGTRLATFSYLKALDFPMFQKSWFSAAKLLRDAKMWIFVGYSLPAADYEFKHLLKRVHLSRDRAPKLVLLTGGWKARMTIGNYKRFFGSIKVFDKGMTNHFIAQVSN